MSWLYWERVEGMDLDLFCGFGGVDEEKLSANFVVRDASIHTKKY